MADKSNGSGFVALFAEEVATEKKRGHYLGFKPGEAFADERCRVSQPKRIGGKRNRKQCELSAFIRRKLVAKLLGKALNPVRV